MKIKNVLSVVFLLLICFSGQQSWALTIVDPFLNQEGSRVVSFEGRIASEIFRSTTSWFSPQGNVYDNQIPIDQYTFGTQFINDIERGFAYAATIEDNNSMPDTSYYARSTIDITNGFISSEANHPAGRYTSASAIFAYTNQLPLSISVDGDPNARVLVGVEVYAKTPGGVPLSTNWNNEWYGFMPNHGQGDVLGYIIFKNDSSYLSWSVERWSWEPSTDIFPTLRQEITQSGSGDLDFSRLDSYVDGIVNGRTNDYYYRSLVQAQSAPGDSYVYAQLNFPGSSTNAVPEPATLLLFSIGGLGLALRRRFQKSA